MKKDIKKYLNQILCGNALQILKQMPDKGVDCCITSPPYWGLRQYATPLQIWDEDESLHCDHSFNIKESRVNVLQTYQERLNKQKGVNTKLFNKKDSFVSKQGFCQVCGAWKGDLGLEPTYDLYIKHLCDIFDEVKRVLKDSGSCFVVIGDCYNKNNKNTLAMIPFRFAIEMIDRSWDLKNNIIWHKKNATVKPLSDSFTIDYENILFFIKNNKYYFKQQMEPATSKNYEERNRRCVWSINTVRSEEHHFAVFPQTLVKACIDPGCPPDGIVLDPFCGSGTTLKVAKDRGLDFIGIDLNTEYVKTSVKNTCQEVIKYESGKK